MTVTTTSDLITTPSLRMDRQLRLIALRNLRLKTAVNYRRKLIKDAHRRVQTIHMGRCEVHRLWQQLEIENPDLDQRESGKNTT